MPSDCAPPVVIVTRFVDVPLERNTIPASLPAPPAPPIDTLAVAPLERLPAILNPPLPPPPPSDCATRPAEFEPSVVTLPLLESSADDALPPAPPVPPKLTLADVPFEIVPATLHPPLPPPPPSDCASMPSALLPPVEIFPTLVI